MKRTITLVIIYILEILFAVCYYVKDIWNAIISIFPFMIYVGDFIGSIVRYFKGFFGFPVFNGLPAMIQSIIVVILLTIIFSILFWIFFGVIAWIQETHRRHVLEKKAQKKFVLSDEERAKFDYKLYQRRFPIRRLISLIVPLLFIFLFIIVRFDRSFCSVEDLYNEGYFDIYQQIKPFIFSLTEGIENAVALYIGFNNSMIQVLNVTWVEWVILALAIILVLLAWWGIFSIFAKPISIHLAKVRAKKAKRKYVVKMERIEYDAWKKAEKERRVSTKGKEFYSEEDFQDEIEVDSNVIGKNTNLNKGADNENKKIKENANEKEKEYLDDISTGVIDLGVIEEDNDEVREAIILRETHFVGEEEIDIVLEKEPIIETIEEEDVYYDNTQDYQDSFERYQPDNLSNISLDDKIKKYNIDVIEEDGEVVRFVDDEHPVIHDYEEKEQLIDNQDNIVVEEENIDDENNDEVLEEDNKKIKPIIKQKSRKEIKPIDINRDRKEVVDYIIKNNTRKANDDLVNSQNVLEKKKEQVVDEIHLTPVHKIKKNKKNIKPIAPMKVNKR